MTEEPSSAPPGTEPVPAEPALAATPHPETPAFEPPPPPPPPPPRRGWTLVPWVYALALIVLGWAVMFLWWNPVGNQSQPGTGPRVDALTQQVQTLSGEVKTLAGRPAGQPQALAALQSQVAALAARKPATPDLSGLENRIAALEHRPAPAASPQAPVDLAPLQQKLASLDQQVSALAGRVDQVGALHNQMAQIGQRLNQLAHDQQTLANQVQSLAASQKDAQSGLTHRIDADAAAIAALQGDIRKIDSSLGEAVKAARIEAALGALQAGRKLGDIPGAPPAVARFASEAPPTVADLRLAFPDVAAKALAASKPADQNDRFLNRVWNRAQGLVTVRQGDHVLVGDPAAGIVARARDAIDAGDLAGAVDALSKLSGPAAQAVAPWMQSAQAVLAARSALRDMAGEA